MSDAHVLLRRVVEGGTLDAEQSARLFDVIMRGEIAEGELAAFLTAQALRKPTIPEITGAARAMRAAMNKVDPPGPCMDLCGTGGDGKGTLNISTAVTFVVAACGVPVAKHGNRNMSSKTGAADVLEALGVRIDLPPAAARRCLEETGVCFLFAQAYHPAMRHVAAVRRALGIRTIFNLLGPLSNPAGAKRQLLGVYAHEWLEPLAHVLKSLGSEKVWVVHGHDGLDEVTTTDITHVAVLERGNVTPRDIAPEEAGLQRNTPEALKGGTAEENAHTIRRLFGGEPGPYRDVVLMNAAAALIVADKAVDLRDGVALAANAIDTGGAQDVLDRLAEATA
ncbi:MAG: anthranilate phosphoribosyltransferase [Alphaproteobacteria bacterium]|nr:anthranilate phosphoribosyltransferase [Alphaproteobacteria bacterium]